MSEPVRKVSALQRFLHNILTSGIKEKMDPEIQVKLIFINSTMMLGPIVLMVFAVKDFLSANLLVAGVTTGMIGLIAAFFFWMRLTRNMRIGAWFLPILMGVFYAYLALEPGGSSSTIIWSLTYPVISIFMIGSRWGGLLTGLMFATLCAVLYVPGLSSANSLPPELRVRIVGSFIIIAGFALAFEQIRKRTQDEVERGRQEQTRLASELLVEKAHTDGIMKNVKEGICLLDKDLRIGPQYSATLEDLLDKKHLGGVGFIDLIRGRLTEKEVSGTQDYLEMFFQPSPPWELLFEINPLTQASFASSSGKEKFLEFSFHPVEMEGQRQVLVTVRDVTLSFELNRKLKEEEDRADRQMRHLFQIIQVKPELLLQFLQDADDEIAEINKQLKDPEIEPQALIENLFQGIHAVKGNAALVGLSAFSHKVHQLEDQVGRFRGKVPQWNDLLEITIGLSKIQAELQEIRDLMNKMSDFQKNLEATSLEQNDLILMTLGRALERLTRETGKKAVLETGQFDSTHVPATKRKVLKDVLVQMIRNSFAHGLEEAEERKTAGKRPEGTIKVSTKTQDGRLHLSYQDDGRGLVPDRIREAARNNPLFNSLEIDKLSDSKIAGLIFHPGFSTAAQAGIHAGRGVGMSLIKSRIESQGGVLKIRSSQGKGLAFDIELPMT